MIDYTEQLTRNFTLGELVASDVATAYGIDNTPPPEAVYNLRALCKKVLQPIRDGIGQAVDVSSGYRCPALNRHKEVRGSRYSQHLRGQAADINADGFTPLELAQKIIELGIDFDQMLAEPTWVHISYNPGRSKQRRDFRTAKMVNGEMVFTKVKI